MSETPMLRGRVHGKTIELDQDAGLPEGQAVSVVVRPLPGPETVGDGLERSFGGWADDAEGLEQYLEWSRQQRKRSRPRTEL